MKMLTDEQIDRIINLCGKPTASCRECADSLLAAQAAMTERDKIGEILGALAITYTEYGTMEAISQYIDKLGEQYIHAQARCKELGLLELGR